MVKSDSEYKFQAQFHSTYKSSKHITIQLTFMSFKLTNLIQNLPTSRRREEDFIQENEFKEKMSSLQSLGSRNSLFLFFFRSSLPALFLDSPLLSNCGCSPFVPPKFPHLALQNHQFAPPQLAHQGLNFCGPPDKASQSAIFLSFTFEWASSLLYDSC